MMPRIELLGVAVLFVLLLVACNGGGSQTPYGSGNPVELPANDLAPTKSDGGSYPEDQALGVQRGVPASSVGEKKSRLDVVIDGRTIPLRNGGKVFLGDGASVEVFVDPYPPTTLRAWLDLYLVKEGEPVLNAEATIEYDMAYMLHGPFGAAAQNLGDGHYLFTLDYIMYGAWGQFVAFRLSDSLYELPVVIVAYP